MDDGEDDVNVFMKDPFVTEVLTKSLSISLCTPELWTQSHSDRIGVIILWKSGIGKETAVDLARRGARVILACRNPKLAEEAVREIQKRSNNMNVVYRYLDLANLKSVRTFATEFLEEEQRLDILINNAGSAIGFVLNKPPQQTYDGFELNFGINHFGHFLLTLLLLERLKKCSPSRIVVVSSDSHAFVKSAMDFTQNSPDGLRYPGLCGYPISKAATILFASELARRLKSTGVTVYSVHPGWVYTNIMVKEGHPLHFFLRPWFWLFLLSERTGAQCSIHCAVDETITDLSGSYFENCQPHPVRSWVAQDDVMCKKLWEVSCQAVGIEYNG
ncbi:retinol dehydrogenase 11-like [Amphiura filiformis]|uniref:retinol dehydrogenase 11-like n=1 Tax=Amphiura filiformis TaxID=82378 RepID=UPI003B217A8E